MSNPEQAAAQMREGWLARFQQTMGDTALGHAYTSPLAELVGQIAGSIAEEVVIHGFSGRYWRDMDHPLGQGQSVTPQQDLPGNFYGWSPEQTNAPEQEIPQERAQDREQDMEIER